MFATEALFCVRGSLFVAPPPGADPPIGMLVRQAVVGGTQFLTDPYPNPVTSIVVPVDALGVVGPLVRFRALIPLGANLGFYRVRAINSWSITAPSAVIAQIRLNAYARIVRPGTVEQIVSDFDTPAGVPGVVQPTAVAGPFAVFYQPIDPAAPVKFNAGDLFELALQAEVILASPIPGDTCIVAIDNGYPPVAVPGGGVTACEIDSGIVGF